MSVPAGESVTVTVVDRIAYAITKREMQDNGYLKVPGRVARAGIQKYLASELGLTDRKPDEIVNVYRPPEEVFNEESLKSYEDVDVTNDHPGDLVDSKSFKKVSVGHATSAGRQNGEFVDVDLLIKDQEAIKDVNAGKAELSAGYEAVYVAEKGTTDDGESYEFVQKKIRINHIALVDKARAGKQARLYDSNSQGAATMKLVTLDNGRTVEVADDATAQLIQTTIDGLRKRAEDAEEATKEANAKAEEEKAKREKTDEEMEKEKEKSSDSAIAARVKDVNELLEKGRIIAGEKFSCDSVDPLTIKREALKKVRDKVDWDKQSEAYVNASWDMEMERTDDDRQKVAAKDSQAQLGADLKQRYHVDGSEQMSGTVAYDSFLKGDNGGSK